MARPRQTRTSMNEAIHKKSLIPLIIRSLFVNKILKLACRIPDFIYRPMFFPAGLVSKRKKGVIRDVAWQKSIISMARPMKRDIIPIHVQDNTCSLLYNPDGEFPYLSNKS